MSLHDSRVNVENGANAQATGEATIGSLVRPVIECVHCFSISSEGIQKNAEGKVQLSMEKDLANSVEYLVVNGEGFGPGNHVRLTFLPSAAIERLKEVSPALNKAEGSEFFSTLLSDDILRFDTKEFFRSLGSGAAKEHPARIFSALAELEWTADESGRLSFKAEVPIGSGDANVNIGHLLVFSHEGARAAAMRKLLHWRWPQPKEELLEVQNPDSGVNKLRSGYAPAQKVYGFFLWRIREQGQ